MQDNTRRTVKKQDVLAGRARATRQVREQAILPVRQRTAVDPTDGCGRGNRKYKCIVKDARKIRANDARASKRRDRYRDVRSGELADKCDKQSDVGKVFFE
jgi:hypothetical protein